MDEYIAMCIANMERARVDNDFDRWRFWDEQKRNAEKGLPIGWIE